MTEPGYDEKHIEVELEKNGEVITSTSGVSMYPMLRHRKDMIVVEKPNRDLKKNDVPLYRMPSGKLILHRILSVKDNSYIIRGDNLIKKEIVSKELVIGVLKEFYRNGKHYDCATSRKYKIYIVINRLSYPLRYLWKIKIRPFLSKIKHFLLQDKKD